MWATYSAWVRDRPFVFHVPPQCEGLGNLRQQYGAPLRPRRYERAARQRGACFEAAYQRHNELTKRHTKQTAAEHLQAEKEPRKLSSLHTKHDVH
eukprot:2991461-Pleurochrysis_carterae.AAC.1